MVTSEPTKSEPLDKDTPEPTLSGSISMLDSGGVGCDNSSPPLPWVGDFSMTEMSHPTSPWHIRAMDQREQIHVI